MNIGLIKCLLGFHKFGEPIKDETMSDLVRTCNICSYREIIMSTSSLVSQRHQLYELKKREIIDDIKSDKLVHANQRLEYLLKELGY